MTGPASRTYAEAVDALNSLQSNAATIEATRKSGGKSGHVQLAEQLEYMRRVGYQPADLDRMNVLHITGTKGKGSTSAFVSKVLTSLAPAAKVGLYTSPHMVAVRERIRINGEPISESLFARYFWEVWDKLDVDKAVGDEMPAKPAYFRYLTIMAMHVFLQEKVDATVLEVGIGGTYDSTNIVPQPITTGVTALGIDHIWVLGKTLPEIAHQKGGIYKPGVPALAIQQPDGLDVLESRAKELKASSFTVIPEHPQLRGIKLGLAGVHQRSNASLAVAFVQSFLASPRCPPAFSDLSVSSDESSAPTDASTLPSLPSSLVAPNPLPPTLVTALEQTRWPGRCQVSPDPVNEGVRWFLDGAHTVESLQCCGEWFEEASLQSSDASVRALIFNCTSGRSGLSLLGTLLSSLSSQPFQHVIFCTNTTYSTGASSGDLTSNAVDAKDLETLATQHELADAWKELTKSLPAGTEAAQVHVLGSVQEAVEVVRGAAGEGKRVDALVAGSLHLVGGVLAVADLPL
ncbi:FolC bifunctional protein [Rhodotorula diobovata]|uniref:Folylpolyglutamate synthase n=1 Tax=Rhodotorula diobovata TaxID=5288 RepID=A0A5C5FMA5_9BASI|nr:FolC bifunctional protein [Rhodotorula diobovata]